MIQWIYVLLKICKTIILVVYTGEEKGSERYTPLNHRFSLLVIIFIASAPTCAGQRGTNVASFGKNHFAFQALCALWYIENIKYSFLQIFRNIILTILYQG